MGNTISINNNEMSVKEYNGQRVVTFKDIDAVHGRPSGTARKRFNDNRERFIEGVDYFNVQKSEKRTLEFDVPNRGLILVTESGYLMLVKSFTDDLAWTVQRELVNNYFRIKEQPKEPPKSEQLTLSTKEYFYVPKKWSGMSVITLLDFNHFTGVIADTARSYLYYSCTKGTDYFVIRDDELRQFKAENSIPSRWTKGLVLITACGVKKLLTYYHSNANIPFAIEEKQPPELDVPELPKPRMANTDELIIALNVLRYLKFQETKKQQYYKDKGKSNMIEFYDKKILGLNLAIEMVGSSISLQP